MRGTVDPGEGGVAIKVYGLAQLERALRQLDPDVAKEMNSSIRRSLNAARDAARARIWDEPPMSGWSTKGATVGRTRGGAGWPEWNPSEMRSGITVRKGAERGIRTGVAVAWRIRSDSPAATIYDKAENGHSARGTQFISNLNRRAKAQRDLWPAWLATRKHALADIEAAVNRAQRRLQQRADQIDGRSA